MPSPPAMKAVLRELRRLFSQPSSCLRLLFWPLSCLIFSAALWTSVEWKIAAEERLATATAFTNVASIARVYSQFLTLSLQQMDQVSLQLRYDWEHSNGTLRLEFMQQAGMFSAPQFANTFIVDRDGMPISSTVSTPGVRSVVERGYFQFHRDNPSLGLHVGRPMISRRTGNWIIPISRRLESVEGTFAGAVVMAVDPGFFTTPYEATTLGKGGLLALAGNDGALRASRSGASADLPSAPVLASVPELLGTEGTRLLEGAPWFTDRDSRFIGWQRVAGFPFIAIAGISQEQAFAPYRQTWATYHHFAVSGTIGSLLFAILATFMAARLEWRNRFDDKVRATYRVATEGGNEGFYMMSPVHDRDGAVCDWEVNDCNAFGARFFSRSRSELIGDRLSSYYTGAMFDDVMQVYREAIARGTFEDEFRVPSASPVRIQWMYRRLVHMDEGVAVTLRDISDIKAHEQELRRLGNEDALTTLPNRHWMSAFLPTALARAAAAQSRIALLFIDLDGFKMINDNYGHAAGDRLLHATALRLKALLRPGDQVVRLGGDEFLIILESVGDDAAITPVALRVIDSIAAPFDVAAGTHVVGASVGISVFPRDGVEADVLLRHADIAMYAAKTAGRGRFRFYEPVLDAQVEARAQAETLLRAAVQNNAFEILYQPRIDLGNGNVTSLEALVRWHHADGRIALPEEFLGMAEDTGLILQLGDLVTAQVCGQLAAWQAMQLPLVPVSLNISPRQVGSRLVERTAGALLQHGLDAELIAFELAESAVLDKGVALNAELHAMQALGIEILVDDVAPSYRTLSLLQRAGIRTLKIDRDFTARLGAGADADIFLKATLAMAHAKHLAVVVEGVETAAQLRMLQRLGCDQAQGNFLVRPLPADAVPALLLSGWQPSVSQTPASAPMPVRT